MLKTLDLFAGAGGLSLGFKQTGHYELVAAAEIKKYARETYQQNIPEDIDSFVFIENVVGYDFCALNERFDGIDIVIGGPPCQGFSNANRQKTRLISMNNALVKEYFRAIKEIRPCAFVMENVSMLKSSTHRFYDACADHDMIEKINQAAKNPKKPPIPMREDTIILSSTAYADLDLLEIAKSEEKLASYKIPYELFRLLEVLNKRKNNTERLSNYLAKNQAKMQKEIAKYCKDSSEKNGLQPILAWLRAVDLALTNGTIKDAPELQAIVDLQKTLLTISEIYDNKLIGKYSLEESKLVFKVKSYAVIDYVNAILGDEYIQHGATLNAAAFGVPQERKRHIVVGIRRDCIEKDFEMLSQPDKYEPVTVWDAIADLAGYEASTKHDCPEISHHTDDKLSDYAKAMRQDSTTVKNHFATATTETAQKRFEVIKQGKSFLDLPPELKTTYSKPERTQKTIYHRLDPKKSSGTVVNVRKSMWIHPDLDRALSLREAARLQSFPDSFVFEGSKDSQYQQVGNAVPPLLAKAIGQFVYEILEKECAQH